jgi:hypothetical protein
LIKLVKIYLLPKETAGIAIKPQGRFGFMDLERDKFFCEFREKILLVARLIVDSLLLRKVLRII